MGFSDSPLQEEGRPQKTPAWFGASTGEQKNMVLHYCQYKLKVQCTCATHRLKSNKKNILAMTMAKHHRMIRLENNTMEVYIYIYIVCLNEWERWFCGRDKEGQQNVG